MYASIILSDEGSEVTAEGLQAICAAAGVRVQPIWFNKFAQFMSNRKVEDLVGNISGLCFCLPFLRCEKRGGGGRLFCVVVHRMDDGLTVVVVVVVVLMQQLELVHLLLVLLSTVAVPLPLWRLWQSPSPSLKRRMTTWASLCSTKQTHTKRRNPLFAPRPHPTPSPSHAVFFSHRPTLSAASAAPPSITYTHMMGGPRRALM